MQRARAPPHTYEYLKRVQKFPYTSSLSTRYSRAPGRHDQVRDEYHLFDRAHLVQGPFCTHVPSPKRNAVIFA